MNVTVVSRERLLFSQIHLHLIRFHGPEALTAHGTLEFKVYGLKKLQASTALLLVLPAIVLAREHFA